MLPATLHPTLVAAARGELPAWAVASPDRREHLARVARLLDDWAVALSLGEDERARWRAAGYLHDALRDESPDLLRDQVPPEAVELPELLLHGPAAAERLRAEGVEDEDLLAAVAYHTTGDANLALLGRAVYAADFLEPGRDFLIEWREELRATMPTDLDAVLTEIVRARIAHRLEVEGAVLPRTISFWNALVGR